MQRSGLNYHNFSNSEGEKKFEDRGTDEKEFFKTSGN
jgi:hypothetical protein